MDPPPSALPSLPVVYDAPLSLIRDVRSLFFEVSEQLGHSIQPFIIHDEKLSASVSLMDLGKRMTQLNNLLDPFLTNAQLSILEGRAIHQDFIQFLLSSVRKVADTIKLYRAYTRATVKADRGETKEAKRILRLLEERLAIIKRESCCLGNQTFLERFNEPFQSPEHKFLSQDLFRLFHPLKHMTPTLDCDLEFVMQILAKHKSIEPPDSNRLRDLNQRLMKLLSTPLTEISLGLENLRRLFFFEIEAKEIFHQTVKSKVDRLKELLQTFPHQLPSFQKKLFLNKLILILSNKHEAMIAPGFLLTALDLKEQNVLSEAFKSEGILYFRSENPTLEQIIPTLKEKCSQIELDLKQEEEIQIAIKNFESRFEIQRACQPPHFEQLKEILERFDIPSSMFFAEINFILNVINLMAKKELHESHFDYLAIQIANWGFTLTEFERLYPLFGEYQKVVQSMLNELSDRVPNDKVATFKEIIQMHLTQSATGRVQDLSPENQHRLYADLLSALNNPFDYSVNFYSYHPQLVSVNQEAASTLERIENLSLLVVRELEQTPPPSNIKNVCLELLLKMRKSAFLYPLVLLRIYNLHPKWVELLNQITGHNLYADFQRENSSIKLERMRKLRQLALAKAPSATPPIEIIGAGPAGLIRAIVVALKGGRPHIFEIEKAEPKERRSNVIVLGSHPDFDLDIHLLRFLGVLEKLEEEKKVGSFESYPTMMIKDLEDALKGCLKSILQLLEEEIFTYEHFLMGVQKEEPANVYFHFGKKEETSNRQPSRLDDLDPTLSHTILKNPPLILLTEGAAERAQTAQLLGLNRIVLSLNSRIRIQVFERTAEGPSLDEIPGRMLNFVVGLKEKGSLLIQSQQSSLHELQLLQARLLFSVPSRDYLIQGLSSEQEAYVNKLMKKIASRSFVIQQIQKAHSPTFPLLQKLIDEKTAMEKALETFNREQATQGRRVFDLNPFASYRYSSTHYVTITMRRLDRLLQFIGNTLLLPGGDVMQEVDPASGSGAQTAIHSAPILYQLLTDIEQHRGHTLTDLLKYTLALTRSMESALEQGFEKRGFYKKETGTIQRHLDTTQKFTKEEGQNLDKLLLKEKNQTPLERQDFKFLVELILKLKALPQSPLFVIKERLIHLLIRNQDTFLAQLENLFDQRQRMFQVPLLIETLLILNEPSLQKIINSLKKMSGIIFSE